MTCHTAALLTAALAFATPAAALAQSAGDDQYRDPFAGENESPQESRGGGDDAPAAAAPAPAPAPVPPSGGPAEPTATVAGTLPRTGLGAGWAAAAGLALIGAGAGLRRSARA